jgi:hypothetical protein
VLIVTVTTSPSQGADGDPVRVGVSVGAAEGAGEVDGSADKEG